MQMLNGGCVVPQVFPVVKTGRHRLFTIEALAALLTKKQPAQVPLFAPDSCRLSPIQCEPLTLQRHGPDRPRRRRTQRAEFPVSRELADAFRAYVESEPRAAVGATGASTGAYMTFSTLPAHLSYRLSRAEGLVAGTRKDHGAHGGVGHCLLDASLDAVDHRLVDRIPPLRLRPVSIHELLTFDGNTRRMRLRFTEGWWRKSAYKESVATLNSACAIRGTWLPATVHVCPCAR